MSNSDFYPPQQLPNGPMTNYALPAPARNPYFLSVCGKWLFMLAFSFLPAAVLGVFPGALVFAVIALVLPIFVLTRGLVHTKAAKLRGTQPVERWDASFLLAGVAFLGVLLEVGVTYVTGDAGASTYPAWLSMLAMYAISLVLMNRAYKANPVLITDAIKKSATWSLTILCGINFSVVLLPFLYVLMLVVLFSGWYGFAFVAVVPLCGAIAFLVGLLKKPKPKPVNPNQIVRPKGLIEWRTFGLGSGMVACLTFVLIAFLITALILGHYMDF